MTEEFLSCPCETGKLQGVTVRTRTTDSQDSLRLEFVSHVYLLSKSFCREMLWFLCKDFGVTSALGKCS